MKLSAPLFILKRNAKHFSKSENISYFEALDRTARLEGFESWRRLSHEHSAGTVDGIAGYDKVVEKFIQGTEAIDFTALHEPYLHLIPNNPSKILDIGSGVGRDAHKLADMGHEVVAIEPMPQFLEAARKLHSNQNIHWVNDSLPLLEKLEDQEIAQFDFVLASAVWHHIDNPEREFAMERISELVCTDGIFALSLRNGPVGGGTYQFPTNHQHTIALAEQYGFEVLVALRDQPSLMAGKSKVKWSKIAFRRC